jgi:hypothetical protein
MIILTLGLRILLKMTCIRMQKRMQKIQVSFFKQIRRQDRAPDPKLIRLALLTAPRLRAPLRLRCMGADIFPTVPAVLAAAAAP